MVPFGLFICKFKKILLAQKIIAHMYVNMYPFLIRSLDLRLFRSYVITLIDKKSARTMFFM